jgi:transcriptional regulator with XRE-family HTH domain
MNGRNTVQLDPSAVEARRRAKLMSLTDLIGRTGLSPMTLWRARKGRPISLRAARAISRALTVKLSGLLAGGATPERPEIRLDEVVGALTGDHAV